MRPFLLFALSTALLLSQLAYAPPHPTCWVTRGVLGANSSPDDHAAINQGRLKALAAPSYQRLEAVRASVAPGWLVIRLPWARPRVTIQMPHIRCLTLTLFRHHLNANDLRSTDPAG